MPRKEVEAAECYIFFISPPSLFFSEAASLPNVLRANRELEEEEKMWATLSPKQNNIKILAETLMLSTTKDAIGKKIPGKETLVNLEFIK